MALLNNVQQPETCQRRHATGIDAFAALLGAGELCAIEHHNVHALERQKSGQRASGWPSPYDDHVGISRKIGPRTRRPVDHDGRPTRARRYGKWRWTRTFRKPARFPTPCNSRTVNDRNTETGPS